MNKTYYIACGIDNNYVEHLATMLNSLFKNNALLRFHIYVLSLNLCEENKNRLQQFVKQNKSEISFIDVDMGLLNSYPIFGEGYLSPATYLRLFIPSLLPQSVEKILYLDADIIVNTNIESLFNTDISDVYLAAVEDAPNESVIIPIDKGMPYFNAGVLLLNLNLLRKTDFLDKALSFIRENKERIFFHDQDVLNALLGNNAKLLPVKWNMLDCFYSWPPLIQSKKLSELRAADKKKCIIHFSGRIKPWHRASIHPLTSLYKKYNPKIQFLKNEKQDESHLFDGLPRYRKTFVQMHLPKWVQRKLNDLICWLWKKFEL